MFLSSYSEMYYFSKTKNLINIEKAINTFKVEWNKPKQKKEYYQKVYDKLSTAIITNLYKEFGFYYKSTICLKTDPSKFFFEVAYGVPRSYIEQPAKNVIQVDPKTKRLKFYPDAAPMIQIRLSTWVIAHPEITTGMIMGGILHEIGHIFQYSFTTLGFQLEGVKKTLEWLDNHNLFGLKPETLERIADKIGKWKIISGDPGWEYSPSLQSSRMHENFADQFAATYGYGQECAAFLTWLENNSYKTYNKYTSFNPSFFGKLLIDLKDSLIKDRTHPEYGKRIRSIIAMIENELKNNKSLTPKERKILEKKIQDIRKLAESIVKKNDRDSYLTKKKKDEADKDIKSSYDSNMNSLPSKSIDDLLNQLSDDGILK